MSTFHGLEMAKQALFAQQAALYTTGHNIANANNKGYTRQRVNFETMSPYPAGSKNRPQIPGQMGTGVQVENIQRIRDKFLDYQFRSENGRSGFWETKSNAFSRLEALLNEPSDLGLSNSMDEFWQSLQDLATNPENLGARSVVMNRALAVTDTFNYISNTIQTMREDLKSQINVIVSDVNSLLEQINGINEQIQKIEPHGYLANDLYDDRDRLIDELSKIVSIKVHHVKSSNSSLDIADGIVKIELVDQQGLSIDEPPVFLLNSQAGDHSNAINELSVSYGANGEINAIHIDGYDKIGNLDLLDSIGSLKGLIEAYGYDDNGNVAGDYPEIIEQLNQMAREFATAFNEAHKAGFDLSGEEGIDFFTNLNSAASITVSSDIINRPELIAASVDGTPGNGTNALTLSEIFNEPLESLNNSSVNTFFESLIGGLGVKAREANRMMENTEILRAQIEGQRMSVSSVSLDEEMTNMIKFQHSYHAAARSMTAIDELLDKIINGMGLVGR